MKAAEILNNIMNRDTYISGKCGVILAELMIKDFSKIHHNTTNDKIKNFLKNTLDGIFHKIKLHLVMNNMTSLDILNLNNNPEIHPENNYFFYKIDGLNNFIRGINNFSVITGIIERGQIFCMNCLIPSANSMAWYQTDEDIIYVNNYMVWSKNLYKKTNKTNLFVAIDPQCYHSYDLLENENPMINHNFSYNFFLLLNDSIDKIVISKDESSSGEKFLLNYFAQLGVITIEEKEDYLMIVKNLLIVKTH